MCPSLGRTLSIVGCVAIANACSIGRDKAVRPADTPDVGSVSTRAAIASTVREQPDTGPVLNVNLASSAKATMTGLPELLLTRGDRMRVGIDPATEKSYAEIPVAHYDSGSLHLDSDDESETVRKDAVVDGIDHRTIEGVPARPGAYTLSVAAKQDNFYMLQIRVDSRSKGFATPFAFRDVPIARGAVHRYLITIDGESLAVRREQ